MCRCECGICQTMPTARECVCCCEIPEMVEKMLENLNGNAAVGCICSHDGFEPVCLNTWVLQTAYFAYRHSYGELEALTHE